MSEATDALRDARNILSSHLSASWRLERAAVTSISAPSIAATADQVWVLTGPAGARARFVVARKARLRAADVALYSALAALLPDPSETADQGDQIANSETALLVSAPWISNQVRDAMAEAGVNYIDDTGNLRVTLRKLPVLLRAEGATVNPIPRRRSETRLSGNQALAVIRFLVDMEPPYTQSELVAATNVSPGYVSKLLAVLEKDNLVGREQGAIVKVEWAELLRERAAQAPPLLGPDTYEPMIARRGLRATLQDLDRLAEGNGGPVGWVTGSAAAQRLSPLSSVNQLLIRTDQPRAVRQRLGLLPARTSSTAGASDVLLLTRNYEQTTARAVIADGVPTVAPSQLVLDCLGGNGRLPAEGEEVIRWMGINAPRWRKGTSRAGSGVVYIQTGVPRSELGTDEDLGNETASRADNVSGTPDATGRLDRRAATTSGAWSDDAVRALLDRLGRDYPVQRAAIVAASLSPTRTVSREEVYRLGDYDPERSLRGFTRPVKRVTSMLVRSQLLDPNAPQALSPLYPSGPRAAGFVVPPEFSGVVRAVMNASETAVKRNPSADGENPAADTRRYGRSS